MITMKDIIREGHPTLRKTAEKVEFPLSEELSKTADEMLEFLINSQNEELAKKYDLRPGVGLAAPQINLSKQIIAVHLVYHDEETGEEEVLISDVFFNPRLISHSIQTIALKDGEGCLSVDREVEGYVPRSKRIKLQYQDRDGNLYELKLRDFEAIVFQHELDHLKGVFFYDHINQDNPLYKPRELELL